MKYDQYGRPLTSASRLMVALRMAATTNPRAQHLHVTAKLDMPNLGQLGGHGPSSVGKVSHFIPTSPFYSTNPNVGTQTRFYGATLLSTDADYVLGTEAIRIVQFDIPCRLIAVTGAATDTAAGAGGIEQLVSMDSFSAWSTPPGIALIRRLAWQAPVLVQCNSLGR